MRVEVCGGRESAVEEGILSVPGAGVEVDYFFVVVGRKWEAAGGCGDGREDGEGEEGGGDETGEIHGWLLRMIV